MQLVCFHLGDQELGAPIELVRETIHVPAITPVFHTPACVAGIANLRGEILVVLDPAVLLGLGRARRDAATRIVIVEVDDRSAGLLVDSLGALREIDAASIDPVPSTVPAEIAAMLRGIVSLPERPIGVLDPVRLLDAPDLAPFARRNETAEAEAHG
jgi:purine-binding chemotaxis protein CheW